MRSVGRLAAILVFSVAANAAADDANPTAADLKARGDEAMRSLHYREALEAYDQSYALKQDPAILYNRARAQQGLGNYPAALDAIEEFVRVAPDDLKQRVPKLAELVADIRAHVALVVVVCPVAGATVTVDGKVAGTTPLPSPLRVGAGSVAIAVEAKGYVPFHKDVAAAGGQLTTLTAGLVSESEGAQPPSTTPPVTTVTYVPAGWRVAAFSTMGVGLAGLAVGGVFGGLVAARTSDANPHCPNKVCDPTGWADIKDAQTFATVSTIAFIAGGVLAAASIPLLLFAPHASRRVAIVPVLGPGFAGIGGTL